MSLVKRLLSGPIGAWLGLYPIFAVNKEDQERIEEASRWFSPNDVY